MSEPNEPGLVEDRQQYGGERRPGGQLPNFAGVGSFGPVVFGVSEQTLRLARNVSRKTSARLEQHEVAGAKPRLEFIAPNLDETTFEILFHAGFGVNPRTEMQRLRDLCLAGTVQYLVLGGQNFGQYLLEEVEETWTHNGPDGVPLVVSASLSLKEYC